VPPEVQNRGAEWTLLHRQARPGAIERLDLPKCDGVGRRIDINADDISQLVDDIRVVEQCEMRRPKGRVRSG